MKTDFGELQTGAGDRSSQQLGQPEVVAGREDREPGHDVRPERRVGHRHSPT